MLRGTKPLSKMMDAGVLPAGSVPPGAPPPLLDNHVVFASSLCADTPIGTYSGGGEGTEGWSFGSSGVAPGLTGFPDEAAPDLDYFPTIAADAESRYARDNPALVYLH